MKIVQIAAIEMTHLKLLKALNETSVREGHEVHCISTMGNNKMNSKSKVCMFII